MVAWSFSLVSIQLADFLLLACSRVLATVSSYLNIRCALLFFKASRLSMPFLSILFLPIFDLFVFVREPVKPAIIK